MLVDSGLVLEGGGTRALFSAGILDRLIENKIYFKNVYSVSASAYVALSYISKQNGWSRNALLNTVGIRKLFSWWNFFTKGSVYNTKLMFYRIPNEILPIDFDEFFNSGQRLTMSMTDLRTGEPVYINDYKDKDYLMDMCCASNSFPVITRTRFIDGRPMTDGGMADAIPIRRAVSDGMKKNLIILTQQSRYRKKLKTSKLITTRYFWHRNFVKTMRERPYKYNSDLDFVEELVLQKQALAYYPEISLPKLITRDPVKLNELYEHGYEMGKKVVEEVKDFFEIKGE